MKKKQTNEKQTYAPEILDAFFFLKNKLKDSPPSSPVPVPTPFQITQVFLRVALCVWRDPQVVTPPLHLHLIDIPLNTLWFDNFPLLISLIAAPEALHMALHCQKPVPFVFNRPLRL